MDQILLLKFLIFFLVVSVLFFFVLQIRKERPIKKKKFKEKEAKIDKEDSKDIFFKEEKKEVNEKEDIKTLVLINLLILIVLMIGVAVISFYVWNDYQKTSKQHKVCVDLCEQIGVGQINCKKMCDAEYGR